MYINKIFTYLLTAFVLTGCAVDTYMGDGDWSVPDNAIVGNPTKLTTPQTLGMYGTHGDDKPHQIAVLLPLSGANAQIGKTIRKSVELATIQSNANNISVSFYDTFGDARSNIAQAISTNPDIIIGPLFAQDAHILRNTKPSQTPALSFTSDANAVGDGVMTMAMLPANGVEEIVKQIKTDDIKKFIIIAPDTNSGHMMASVAQSASDIYEMPLVGIFFYTEKDSDSIKNTALSASMYNTRTAAHTRARQVISDVLTNERLTPIEKSNLHTQLEKLEKTETVGSVPFDGILFLGNGDDTKALASFLRYYNVGARDAAFYGTTMWDGSDIASDYTLSGAKYATLPATNTEFATTYEQVYGVAPNRLAGFGYDATNMAINMVFSDQTHAQYLLSPGGYIGTDGIFRINPNGTNDRALRIMQLNGSGTPSEIRPAQTNFITPIYSINPNKISATDAMSLNTNGIDPDDYIRLPERFRDKYRSKTIGADTTYENIQPASENVITVQSDNTVIKPAEFDSAKQESVKRTYIDEYEIIED